MGISPPAHYPTFAGFRRFLGQDRAFDCLEQRQFALPPSKARLKPPIEGAKAPHSSDLGTLAQTSPIAACCMINPAAHAGAGGARSWAIKAAANYLLG